MGSTFAGTGCRPAAGIVRRIHGRLADRRNCSDDCGRWSPTRSYSRLATFWTAAGASSPRGRSPGSSQPPAPVPVYGPFSPFMGTGIVGGRMADVRGDRASSARRTAIALLDGADPATIVHPKVMPTPWQLDWRQMKRWGVSDNAVPADAIVRFREPSLWEAYREFVHRRHRSHRDPGRSDHRAAVRAAAGGGAPWPNWRAANN